MEIKCKGRRNANMLITIAYILHNLEGFYLFWGKLYSATTGFGRASALF